MVWHQIPMKSMYLKYEIIISVFCSYLYGTHKTTDISICVKINVTIWNVGPTGFTITYKIAYFRSYCR
ncbi:hypothetical protein V1527DRAFT_472760, partial [Lipomyces starkeyi]